MTLRGDTREPNRADVHHYSVTCLSAWRNFRHICRDALGGYEVLMDMASFCAGPFRDRLNIHLRATAAGRRVRV
jgi:hypothetical protein